MASCLVAASSLRTRITDSFLQGSPADNIILPDNHTLVAHWNAEERRSADSVITPRILQTTGHSGALGNTSESSTGTPDPSRIEFLLEGLAPTGTYVLGYRWWDVDPENRVQSIQFGCGNPPEWQTVLPAAPAAAFLADKPAWAQGVLPIPAALISGGKLQVAVVSESGTAATVQQLFLTQKQDGPEVKRVLILTGDDYAGHHWRSTAPALAAVLRQDPRFEVSISESPAFLGSPLLSHYDVVILHFKNYDDRLPLGDEVQDGLKRFLEGGGGAVLSHFACGAFQEWGGFESLAGRIWNPAFRGHDPHGTFTVRMASTGHPITTGMEDFEVVDELYTCLDGTTPITVLCDAVSVVDKKTYPIAFSVDAAPGRVFHCVLGHDTRAYESSGAATLYRRGTAWAAGLDP